jgi:hypothetical protein
VDLSSSTDVAEALAFAPGGGAFVAGTARGVGLVFEIDR